MTLAFNRAFEPRYGEAVDVAPGVRRITARNPGPFTFLGTNTFLIGAGEIAVLDPGPADPAHIEAILHETRGGDIAQILVSHTHRDHSPGARLLRERTGAPILAAGPHRLARPLMAGSEAERLDAAADWDFRPDIALSDGAVVEGREHHLEALATPGHAANHLAFALLGTDLLFSGDHVMGWATTVVAPPDGAMADYMASLERLRARPERRYLPAHGAAIEDAGPYVRALHAHRKMRETTILERIRSGDRTIAEVVSRVYADLDPRLLPAAALSTLAHLEHLVDQGIIATEGGADLDGRYWVTG